MSLSGIYEISKILARPARLEATLSSVLNLLSSFLDLRHGTIMLLDSADIRGCYVGVCWSEALESEGVIDHPRTALDQVIATGMPLIVDNVAKSPHFAASVLATSREPSGFICVPIKIDGRAIGTLSIDRPRDAGNASAFDYDVRFLSMVANLIGQTVHLHQVIARDRERLMERSRLLEKQLDGRQPARLRASVAGIIGDSRPIRSLIEKIEVVAKSNATVLLRGESGTGKELFARAIHELSPRAKAPFIKVNCAALPESVLESELFGHEKGAFTGAVSARKGRFELADGGTIFLDEIGEISAAFQAKLLRVLQEGEFDRVGSTRTQKVNVRVVAATNRDLEDAVTRGTFRADLYYRISVIPLMLPALRDRKGDIPALARSFLNQFNRENDRELHLTESAIGVLKSCYFPGNVRELQNCIYRTATMAKGDSVEAQDFGCGHGECLSATLWKTRSREARSPSPPGISLPSAQPKRIDEPLAVVEPSDALREKPCTCGAEEHGEGACVSPEACGPTGLLVSREKLVEAMERCGWVQAKAARLLNLTPRQIGYALKRHNVPLKRF
ncbi:MAG: nif-specific transcriptional activator NifA [Pseudomonadota bacterium]